MFKALLLIAGLAVAALQTMPERMCFATYDPAVGEGYIRGLMQGLSCPQQISQFASALLVGGFVGFVLGAFADRVLGRQKKSKPY